MAARIAVLLVLLTAGVAGLPSAAQTLATVKVASAGIASDIGFFLAHKKGYFRAEGLNVELTQLANSPQMIGPLGRGQLDVGAGTVAVGSTMRSSATLRCAPSPTKARCGRATDSPACSCARIWSRAGATRASRTSRA
jgi:ABC-type nitrate/sulfonate/bicarbonate transport system substrate-binding protein